MGEPSPSAILLGAFVVVAAPIVAAIAADELRQLRHRPRHRATPAAELAARSAAQAPTALEAHREVAARIGGRA